jgi:hypothetical protein
MTEIYGTIGYSIYKNKYNKKIIIFADMHDTLPNCKNNFIKLSDWLIKKIKTCKILIEEIPRDNNVKLIDLWNNSLHTQEIKNLFLLNQNKIDGIDIRYFLMPFSWNILNETNNKKYDITLESYLYDLHKFLKLEYINKSKMKYYRILNQKSVEEHFNLLKIKYKNFLKKYEYLLNTSILEIFKNNKKIFEELEDILDDCMEWYCCYLINIYRYKNVILFAGLYHTSKIHKILLNYYKMELIYQTGMTNITDKEDFSCKKYNNILNNI